MITAIWDSFCRALIRFFDNRFVPKENTNFYEIEIARLHTTINKFLEERRVPIITGEVESSEEMKPLMAPIESSFQRRIRLENESRAEWARQMEEAKAKIAQQRNTKPTEDLEKEVGVAR